MKITVSSIDLQKTVWNNSAGEGPAERVRAAIKNSGLVMPGNRITINLAPADLRRAGPSYDLPAAIGILTASEQISTDELESALIVGELGLDGVISIAAPARGRQCKRVFVPADDGAFNNHTFELVVRGACGEGSLKPQTRACRRAGFDTGTVW